MIAILISAIALIISIISYFKKNKETLKWEYTDKGIEFYDKTGKKILIKAEE